MRGARALAVATPFALALSVALATPATAAFQEACVTNPAEVIDRQPTEASTSADLPVDMASTLDSAAAEGFDEAAAPGAIVGVRTPEGTWSAAYGVADPATEEPMATDMHTRIGSVTKTFTGTLILQLAQEGKLSLTDTIDMYYPGIPNGDRITLAQLANMTSGIAGYFTDDFLDVYFSDPQTVFTPEQLIEYGVAASPIFEPGAMFNYSNTNTVLLGKVIESVTGQPVGEVYQERILEPLGLTNTVWPGDSTDIPAPYPQGFTLQGTQTPGVPQNATNWNPSFGWTAGAMISSLDDLLTYARALGTGQGLLDPDTQTRRLQSFPEPSGYGLAVGCIGGWVGHTGELPGYNTTLYYDTTTDTSVVVMVNSDIASGACTESPVLPDNPTDVTCSPPAVRIFVALSEALGHTFQPPPFR